MPQLMERLHRDHRNLSRLYDMLEEQVGNYRSDSEREPDLLLILDIIAYLDDYPKIYHHPLEEAIIGFMVERGLGNAAINEAIHHQHHELAQATERLSRLFKMVANDQVVPIDRIRDTLSAYLELSRAHLQAEEDRLFPMIERVLDDQDWQLIDARLPERRDPLFSEDPDEAFAELKSRL